MGEPAKFILLTGGNSGIGLEACKILCAEGHKVVATVRSDEKGEHMLSEVKSLAPNADINYMICEMDDPRNVKAFAAEFKAKWLTDGRMLDVLVNNAGVFLPHDNRVVSKVNPEWEQTLVVNAMAPILLTDLLIDNLKETADKKGEARVVMVNSSATTDFEWHESYQTDMDDIMIAAPGKYTRGIQTYKNAKVALMMATLAMTDEIEESKVKVNSMCPGFVPGTNLTTANAPQTRKMAIAKCLERCFGILFGKSPKQGGQYIVDVVDGERGSTQGIFYVKGEIREAAPQVRVKENQKKMLQILREMANSV